MSGSMKVGLMGFVMAFLFVTSCHDEEVSPPHKPGEGRSGQHSVENQLRGDTIATDSTPRDTTVMAATANDTTATDVTPVIADTAGTDDTPAAVDTATAGKPPVPVDTTATDATPVTEGASTAPAAEAPTTDETPATEETSSEEETPAGEETPPAAEEPPADETSAEETPATGADEEPATGETETPDDTAGEETPPVEETPTAETPVEATPPPIEPPVTEEPAPVAENPPVVESPQPTAPSTNVIYEETIEGTSPFSTAHDWDIGSWAYALQFVNTPVYKGTRSARFEIQEDQELVANGKRAEITIVKGAEGDIGKETWYSFAVYFPSVGYEYDDEREVINQWFQGESPATSLRTQRDRILLESGNTLDSRVKYDVAPITKDTWHTVVMHFIHSYGSDGLIELWYDGVKKLTIRGGNMYDTFLPKWKIGLYKSAFKYNTSDVTRRVIYFDNVRVGNETSTFETMNPGM